MELLNQIKLLPVTNLDYNLPSSKGGFIWFDDSEGLNFIALLNLCKTYLEEYDWHICISNHKYVLGVTFRKKDKEKVTKKKETKEEE